MTQEEKQLLLKDLCARLPYGVKFQSSLNNESSFKITAGEWWEGERERITYILSHIQEFKYYLRPMSNMTEEEIKTYHSYCECNDGDFTGEVLYFDTIESFDYLTSIYIDYRGLIEKGLVLEAKEGMYNN